MPAALAAPFSCRLFVFGFAVAAAAGFLAAMMHGIHSSPGPLLRLFFRDSAFFVTLFNVRCLAFLFVSILRLITSRHDFPSLLLLGQVAQCQLSRHETAELYESFTTFQAIS